MSYPAPVIGLVDDSILVEKKITLHSITVKK